ncbi:SGNH/GDSL hydrolase family protein [Flexithrix dorotheae]|uniref:SGNH/GDSL hydrolase family protein n=1 Tax=Flexithrix dorotheae TaxID=70993 RepID=UPI000372E93C|nr:SGNH/GDSL hydrolase family protein [Flexithrix dorotheae]
MTKYLLISLFILTSQLSFSQLQTLPDFPENTYINLRGSLQNCFTKFEKEKKGRVVFLGGSITHMNGWREMVCKYLQERFPETEFDFIDAGIPSTGSTPGAFRFSRDVLAHGTVDLLFEEATVNDRTNGRTSQEEIRGMEGIIRQARLANPAMDIVMLYFVFEPLMEDIRSGKTPEEIINHEKVAEHYQVTSINLAREVTERIDNKEFNWEKFGGTHPAPFGHQIYTNSIKVLFEHEFKNDRSAYQIHPKTVPEELLDPNSYVNGRLVPIKKARTGFKFRKVKSWKAPEGEQTRPGFVEVPMLVAKKKGAKLKFKFRGKAVGIFVIAGMDVGMIDYKIDGKKYGPLDQFTQWSESLHLPWLYLLDGDLDEKKKHKLVIKTARIKNPKSKGYACRIVHFAVNGE